MRRAILGSGFGLSLCSAMLFLPSAGYAQGGGAPVVCGEPYVISKGDSLSSLAKRAYGDPKRFGILYEANRGAIGGDPGNVSLGLSILVPCLDANGQPILSEASAQAGAEMQAAVTSEGPLEPAELDTLFGPVALFADPLLTQVLMAATFPLDVVKADRFIKASSELSDKDRATAIEKEAWDQSVKQLAAGFPDVIARMADHIDWTEQAGEAVLAQTDDVLASIQRLRTKAEENGYLADNEAQAVEEVNGFISIEPANREVIYVPTYDSQVVYSTPMASSAAYNPYYYGYDDDDWSDALAAGAIIFGGALVLDEIFDDDDILGDGWVDGGSIDWDRGDINVDRGDINIDRGDVIIGDGDRAAQIKRPQRPEGGGSRIGGAEDAALAGRPDRTFAPDPASRDVARKKIETRKATVPSLADLPATRPSAKVPSSRATAGAAPKVRSTTASRPTTAKRPTTASRPTKVSKPATTRRPTSSASYRSAPKTAFQPSGGGRASAGASRGRASSGGGRRR